ncbi:MAG: DUF2933 domain-containing protein [Rhodospirillales bacterium]|nr:DUF2933 domain-containing protein [Rhodospirillales bacterium]
MDEDRHDRHAMHPMRSRANWVLIGLLVVGGFYLVTEHRAHLVPFLGYWPLLLVLLLCPLMHIFMHGGHNDHQAHEKSQPTSGGPSRGSNP